MAIEDFLSETDGDEYAALEPGESLGLVGLALAVELSLAVSVDDFVDSSALHRAAERVERWGAGRDNKKRKNEQQASEPHFSFLLYDFRSYVMRRKHRRFLRTDQIRLGSYSRVVDRAPLVGREFRAVQRPTNWIAPVAINYR